MLRGELLPDGVRDYLAADAERHRYLERELSIVFKRWGYAEVITPCFEFYEHLQAGMGRRVLEKAYKFCDNRGRILALRPDMTTPIARLTATSLAGDEGPWRLFYLANVFRVQKEGSGRLHEFYQAGGEILGIPTVGADAEIIALAIACLDQLGITQYKVGIGQVAFLRSILDDANLTREESEAIMQCLQERNLVRLERTLRATKLSGKEQNFLWEVLTKNGNGGFEVVLSNLTQVGEKAREELLQVEELFRALAAYGVKDKIYLDLGIVRNLDYYTGVIFEIYGPGLGHPVGGGGRYDRLLEKFGRPLPATGFALGFPELLELCASQGTLPPAPATDYLVVPEPGNYTAALLKARELRREGYRVEMELRPVPLARSLEYAARRGIKEVLLLAGEEIEVLPVKENN